jgi:hypothetical protein
VSVGWKHLRQLLMPPGKRLARLTIDAKPSPPLTRPNGQVANPPNGQCPFPYVLGRQPTPHRAPGDLAQSRRRLAGRRSRIHPVSVKRQSNTHEKAPHILRSFFYSARDVQPPVAGRLVHPLNPRRAILTGIARILTQPVACKSSILIEHHSPFLQIPQPQRLRSLSKCRRHVLHIHRPRRNSPHRSQNVRPHSSHVCTTAKVSPQISQLIVPPLRISICLNVQLGGVRASRLRKSKRTMCAGLQNYFFRGCHH